MFEKKTDKRKSSIALDKSTPGHYAKKFVCPNCRHKKYVRYFDFENNEYLPEEFGRCDREEHCQYFVAPWEELKQNNMGKKQSWNNSSYSQPAAAEKIEAVSKDVLEKTMRFYEQNVFVQWLIGILGEEKAMEAVYEYYIGTAKGGGTIFWQIDQFKRIRTGTKMFYKPDGHRMKGNPDYDKKTLYMNFQGYKQCLFGEHLLYEKSADCLIGIVESEKSAIICSKYIICIEGRQICWISSSGSNGLTADKIGCLSGREVVLLPDFSYSARATWGLLEMRKMRDPVKGTMIAHPDGEIQPDYESAAMRLRRAGCASVSFYDPFPELNDGSDIADYLINEPPPDDPDNTPVYDMPNFESFTLSEVSDINVGDMPIHLSWDFNEQPVAEVSIWKKLDRIKTFNIIASSPAIKVEMDQQGHEKLVEEFMNQENIQYAVYALGICKGSIAPLK